ncbi:hypothetical protein [Pedobacter cryophilus]|uniref:hypothetical protein n=1 Tax=Pedobacter cryophilus TaxID=2571271 RepID=UPI00197D8F01|nr:hypothetical protein [Pedobacter cryophilus]
MQVIKLKIKDSIYEKLIWLLSKFSKDEIEIIHEDENFISHKKYLQSELDEILKGEAKFIDVDDAEKQIDDMIKKNHI